MPRSKYGYLGRKDFTGKGRMSRRLGGKYFTKQTTHRTKALANKKAKMFRAKGKLARVVKLGVGRYCVYTHTK
tara:strand:- start:633 stop:851 length:219 start_codon:yes stop_codon:yes gene_type:complete